MTSISDIGHHLSNYCGLSSALPTVWSAHADHRSERATQDRQIIKLAADSPAKIRSGP